MAKATLVSRITYHVLHIKRWIQGNQKEFWLLVIILLVGAFFRLYKISDYMTFLGDEGRDAIVVRRLLVDFDPILIGPRTSIGDMYLGPLYYYMMAIPLLLANFSPVGPSVMVAFLGMVTTLFVWFVVREFFSKKTLKGGPLQGEYSVGALIAAFLYAVSPVVIIYSRSSWNPNIMPFFSLLTIYSIWKFWYEKKYKWLVVAGISMAFCLQSHYLGLLLIPTLGIFWILAFKGTGSRIQGIRKRFLSYTLYATILFFFLMSPLVIFDARHGWRNYESMRLFFTQRQTTVNLKPWKGLTKIWPIFKDDFIVRIVAGTNSLAGKWIAIILAIFIIWQTTTILYSIVVKKKKMQGKKAPAFLLIATWLGVGLLGMSLYKQHIYDHYFGFLFAAPFLVTGALLETVYKKFGDRGKIFAVVGIALLAVSNLCNNPLRDSPNYQMKRAIEVSKKIEKEVGGERFNLAVIAERNYEDGYQYFLEKGGVNVTDIDPQKLEETTTDQLFVVCEMPKEKCDPTHSPKAEVANFGWSKVEDFWEVSGAIIFKLVHTQ